jgi:Nif-specific regulatory protein
LGTSNNNVSDATKSLAGLITGQPAADYRNVQILLDILEFIGTSALNLDRLLEGFLQKIIESTNAERAIIMFRNEKGDLIPEMGIDPNGRISSKIEKFSRSIPLEAMKKKEAILNIRAFNKNREIKPTMSMEVYRLRSVMCIPLETMRGVLGVLYLDSQANIKIFEKKDMELLKALCGHLALHIENARLWTEVMEREESQRKSLEAELARLNQSLVSQQILVGESPVMRHLFAQIREVAKTDATVLLLGETGTGKESLARSIHDLSLRKDKPFIVIDCCAIPENLLESELFGHEKGAFTGALSRKAGKFEIADGGTIFLDEIGDMPLSLQAKLLRVLEQKEIQRIGAIRSIKIDFRVIAATNRVLIDMVDAGRFRSDLFYRLNVVHMVIPPLRERGEDRILLAKHFLAQFAKEYGKTPPELSSQANAMILAYQWPGNIREMKHRMQRSVILTQSEIIESENLELTPVVASQQEMQSLEESLAEVVGRIAEIKLQGDLPGTLWEEFYEKLEWRAIEEAMDRCNANKSQAAGLLGMERRKIARRMMKSDMPAFSESISEPVQKVQEILGRLLDRRVQRSTPGAVHPSIMDLIARILAHKTYDLSGSNKRRTGAVLGITFSTLQKLLNR